MHLRGRCDRDRLLPRGRVPLPGAHGVGCECSIEVRCRLRVLSLTSEACGCLATLLQLKLCRLCAPACLRSVVPA